MRKRTPEESAAYFRAYRARKKAAAGAPATPPPKQGATPESVIATPAPCPSCAAHAATLAIAQEMIATLEAQLTTARRMDTATPSAHKVTPEDAEALRQRVVSDKINSFNRGPVIGTARV
jgi:hypothetical protein